MRILDKENAEMPGFAVLCIIGGAAGAFSVTTVPVVLFGVATGAAVSSFLLAGALTSVIEKVGFL